MSTPPATTATVPTASAASCAAASMPRARPDTTTSPAKPRSRARVSANLRASARGVAGADHGDHLLLQQMRMAQHADQRRRRIQRRQPARIFRLAGRDHAPAQFRQRFQLARGIARIGQDESSCRRRAAPCAAVRPARRAAEPKRAIRLWKVTGPTCSVRASLSQSRRSLVSELHHGSALAPIRGSSPRSSRRIFSRCMTMISSDSGSASAA